MWAGLLVTGFTMAVGTLLMFDYALPGGLLTGSGDLVYARTLAFTTLVLFQLFNVFNARSDHERIGVDLFRNRWLWGAVLISLALQIAVVHLPVLQRAFQTASLSAGDWAICILVASSVVWIREGMKVLTRRFTAVR
jgi:Ca2+-transporting ATPase